MPHLTHIAIFPIKSLDRLDLTSIDLLPSGALKGDREFAIFDGDDRVVNGKRTPLVQGIRAHYAGENRTVHLSASGHPSSTFHLDHDRPALETWLSDYFEFAVHLKQNTEMGFPDDPISPGPTIISTQTLETVAQWYDGMTIEEARSRFRTNLEIDAPFAFWEDQLFATADQWCAFAIDDLELYGVNPCQRCIVPTRDSQSADPTPSFQKTFLKNRSQTLPPMVERSRFNHFYRLAVNTRAADTFPGGHIKLGASLLLLNSHF